MRLATTTEDFDRFFPTYAERIAHIYEAGFRCIDLSLYTPSHCGELLLSDNWRENAARIKTLTEALGMSFVQAHSPGGNPLDPGAQGGKLAELTVRSIEVCGALGIPQIVVHAGFGRDLSKEEFFLQNRAFYHSLIPVMEETGVNVLVENSTRANMGDMFYLYTGEDMVEFVRSLDHPQFHICWDTGHGNCEGAQCRQLAAMGSELHGVHINDNRGFQDEHILPYMGTVSMDDVMKGLLDAGYKGVFTFECGNALRPAKFWLGDRQAFDGDARLSAPTLEMQDAIEALMYQIGKHILTAYGCFEG